MIKGRNIVRTKEGDIARNRHGSCGVLAICSIKGMKYEDGTAWAIKNGMAARIKNGEVSGMTLDSKNYQKLKKIGAKKTTVHIAARQKGMHSAEEIAKYKNAQGIDEVAYDLCKISAFARRNPSGRFMLVTRNHAVALVNGVIINNGSREDYQNQIVKVSIKF
jgi:hypothetical protein